MNVSSLSPRRGGPFVLALGLLLCGALSVVFTWGASVARALPDNRGYELVTRYEEGGHEAGVNGLEAFLGIPSSDGSAFDWQAIGGCCGASSGGYNVYRSDRAASGWQARSLTPLPPEPLIGFEEWEGPVFFSPDLEHLVWTTPSSFAAGDHRPAHSAIHDLYLQGPLGELSWISQGPTGNGSERDEAIFDEASPDGSDVLFSSAEKLTANATPLASLESPPKYLYLRDVGKASTSLIDVSSAGTLLSPYGASAGAGGDVNEGSSGFLDNSPDAGKEGTLTNSVSANGEKVFFETPPPDVTDLPAGEVPHLYMRDLADGETTPLDNPASSGSAQYEGASKDGSMVFFTSDEGLDGAATAKELYVFNTTPAPIGSVPPMSSLPVANAAGGILGVSAIANDGSRVFFAAESVLAANADPAGQTATAGQPNLYGYDTQSAQMTFIAPLSLTDVDTCDPNCGTGTGGPLVAEPDLSRQAYPTPDGSTLVFQSSDPLTGPDGAPPPTTLTAEAPKFERTISVASTAGLAPKEMISIGTGGEEQVDTIESIDSPTQLTVREFTERYGVGISQAYPAGTQVAELNFNAYRYSFSEGSLTCISCTPAGVAPTGSVTLGYGGGGSYAPPQQPIPLSEDGSRVFFTSPDPLAPEAEAADTEGTGSEPTSVYEWESGKVSLITPHSAVGTDLDGTTPSGDDVFFTSRLDLVPGVVTADLLIYDARVDGGFPAPATPTPCTVQNCRAQSGSTAFFPVPASQSLPAEAGPGQAPTTLPTFTVAKITAAQRARFARTGQLALTVTATGAGRIDVSAQARMPRVERRVAQASATLDSAGKVTLRLDLSAAARRMLAHGRSMQLQLEVSYSAGGGVSVAELKLAGRHAASRSSRGHTHA